VGCVWGQLGRILGYPWDPLDSMEGCVWRDNYGGSWDVHGILWTAWRVVCGGTTREDPEMSLGFSRQHGGLCVGGQLGRILGCPMDPPDSMEGCVWGDN